MGFPTRFRMFLLQSSMTLALFVGNSEVNGLYSDKRQRIVWQSYRKAGIRISLNYDFNGFQFLR